MMPLFKLFARLWIQLEPLSLLNKDITLSMLHMQTQQKKYIFTKKAITVFETKSHGNMHWSNLLHNIVKIISSNRFSVSYCYSFTLPKIKLCIV